MSPSAPLIRRIDNADRGKFTFGVDDFFKPRSASPSKASKHNTPSSSGRNSTTPSRERPPPKNDIQRSKRKADNTPHRAVIDEVVLLSDSERETGEPSESTSKKYRPDAFTPSPPPANRKTSAIDPMQFDRFRSGTREPREAAKPTAKALKDCDGTAFDFSADPKVLSLQKKIAAIVDPDGRRDKSSLQAYCAPASVKAVSDDKTEAKSKAWKPGSKKGLASFNDFRCANGAAVVKEMRKVVEDESDSAGSSSSGGTKYLGNRPIRPSFKPPSRSNSLHAPSTHPTAQMFDAALANAKGEGKGPQGLAAEPTLKHFDANIVSLIESEIMSLDGSTTWADVAGLEGAKKILREIVVWPFLRPDIFKGIRAPPKGVLLFGPPGTGKTMIGRCVASQCKATFFNISASSLTSKWVGEGEKLVRALFAVARLKLPSVIFIDEIDSLLSSRSESEHESSRRIKTEFLVQLDGVATSKDERLLVLGATNRPYELDEAARRRFAKRIYVGLPEREARIAIVQRSLEGVDHAIGETDYEDVARLTEGYSGADMHQLCAEAAMGPVRDALTGDIENVNVEAIRAVGLIDLQSAARVVRATVVEKDLKVYAEWDKTFGCLL